MQTQTRRRGDLAVPAPTELGLLHASRVAAALFARAKAECCSAGPSLTRPMSDVLLLEDGRVLLLQGLIFHDHPALDKDQHAMAVKLIAYSAGAWAVIDIGDAYGADRCGACGMTHTLIAEPCPWCHAPPVLPRDNPFRRGFVVTVLHLRESTTNHAWIAEQLPNGDGRSVSWVDIQVGKPYVADPMPRFEAPWHIDDWMVPHTILNLPVIGRFLGYRVNSNVTAAARRIEADAPPNFEFLRIDPERMSAAVRRVQLESLVG